ncbi:unnamed protein product [Caenorhabditis auriculariae]|uniref:Polycystin cation channel PKD1/PKD2 domain-containing protein n=1 Tax=Caenorhabditis auriculariae TaxID=2777116 RepID=A0A8S1HKF2_9PELO|nr:unnamed protein product [Caenorhabditis auriculariae]
MDYSTAGWDNPPPIAHSNLPTFENALASEEYEDVTKKRKNQPPTDHMTFKQALMASHVEKMDGTMTMSVKSLFEVGMYAIFLLVLVFAAFSRHSVQTYYYTKVVNDLFVARQGSDSEKAFTDVAAMSDVFDYLNEVLITGLYSTESNAQNRNQTDPRVNETAMVYFENKLLGQPRIRMLKVTNKSCSVVASFSREIKECFASYEERFEDKTSFGPANSDAYVYSSAEKLETNSLEGSISTYGGGGFVQRLPLTDSITAQAYISQLSANRWISRGTRAVIVDFALYNGNINLFCVIQLLFELPATGGVIPTARLTAMDLIRYQGTFGKFMIAIEGIFTGFVAFFVFEEIFEVIRSRLRYFASFWNLIDIITLSLCGAAIVLSYRKTKISTNRINQILSNGLQTASFDDVVAAENWYRNIVAILLFLAWIKVFKYISVNKTMSQLSATLTRSAKDIGGFAVMFAVFFFAYAQFGYLTFGTQISDYSTFYDAVFALLRTILGDFDFNALEKTNRILGPAFFISYVFFVFFVLLVSCDAAKKRVSPERLDCATRLSDSAERLDSTRLCDSVVRLSCTIRLCDLAVRPGCTTLLYHSALRLGCVVRLCDSTVRLGCAARLRESAVRLDCATRLCDSAERPGYDFSSNT